MNGNRLTAQTLNIPFTTSGLRVVETITATFCYNLTLYNWNQTENAQTFQTYCNTYLDTTDPNVPDTTVAYDSVSNLEDCINRCAVINSQSLPSLSCMAAYWEPASSGTNPQCYVFNLDVKSFLREGLQSQAAILRAFNNYKLG